MLNTSSSPDGKAKMKSMTRPKMSLKTYQNAYNHTRLALTKTITHAGNSCDEPDIPYPRLSARSSTTDISSKQC